jgi:ribosomal protein S18 acetylase RimI-like enzyme
MDVPLNVVAQAAGSAVGQVSATALDPEGRVELISMWVDPAARGAGAGEALVAEVVEWARLNGAAAVVLSVKKMNAPAIGLYRRMGFVPTDEPADDGEMRMRLPLSR